MDIQVGLTIFLRNMVSKILVVIFCAFLFSSCWEKSMEDSHQAYLVNETDDTIYCYEGDNFGLTALSREYVLPREKALLSNGQFTQFQDIRRLNNQGDSVYVYTKYDTVVWYPPLRKMPDSIHSYYNENSWEITKGGSKNKYTISTFRIYKSDFKNKK